VYRGGLSWFGATKFKVPTRNTDVWGTRTLHVSVPPAVYYCLSKSSAKRKTMQDGHVDLGFAVT
jgi:hypothetical protein